MTRWQVAWPGGRAAVQFFFLGIFSGILVSAARGGILPVPADGFLRWDPLAGLMSGAAARTFLPLLLWGGILLAATAIFGRFFCGWICPLGTYLDAVGACVPRRRPRSLPTSGKFWLLAALMVVALAGVNLSGWFDPLVMASRAVYALAESPASGTRVAIAWSWLLVVGGLTLLAPRFWCRSLCPLGAMLSLAGWRAGMRRRIGESCSHCGLCQPICPMGQTPGGHSASECLVCRRCESVCKSGSISFGFWAEPLPLDQKAGCAKGTTGAGFPDGGRRGLLLGAGGLAISAVVGGGLRWQGAPLDLRPPGVSDGDQLLARCMGCGACWAACPTGALQPQFARARFDTPFAPRLVPRQGPCLSSCTICASVCPTGAIPSRDPVRREPTRIGLAVVDPKRCLPWARGERCVICLDACPEEFDAISLERSDGGVFVPQVDAAKCTGCGACEYQCPVDPGGAIRVEPLAVVADRSEL